MLWRKSFITTGKKSSSHLSGGCTIIIMTGKKDTVVCLAGARSLLRPEKKDTVVCLLGARFWRLQPKKKDTVVCLVGCAVVSVFGSGGKLVVFLLWRESFITTGKKKFQSSVWRVVLLCQFLVLCNEFVLVLVKIDLIHFEH